MPLFMYAKNCFLLKALLLSYFQSVFFLKFIQYKKRKTTKNRQKCGNYAIENFNTLVVSMVISLVGLIKIGDVSSKFCRVSRGVILFFVSVKHFE